MAFSMAKYYDDVVTGAVFIGSTAAAGTAFPISTGTAVTAALWNTNPNKRAVILGVNFGYTSGTIALGEFGLANQNVGFQVATGAAMTAFNTDNTLVKNALLGSGLATSMRWSPAATTTLAAGGTACWWAGKSIESATAGLGIFNCACDVDGLVIAEPGQIVFPCGSVAQTGLFTISLIWKEVDLS